MPLLSSLSTSRYKCVLYNHTNTMFPADDSNSFTVPYSDQFLLYSSTLLDDANINDYNHNLYSPFFSSDDQNIELQNSLMVQHHEEEPILTAFEEFTMADTSCNNRTNMWTYCATENFHHNDLANDPMNVISASEVGGMKIDKVSKNVSLSKKDRHSKINTAQGPRDRRMRLSLDIAKRFFGLQDKLGFDKASKTVDWLLSKSQSEINKVASSKTNDVNNDTSKSSDSFGASECCEDVSEVVNKDDNSQTGEMDINMVNIKSSSKTKKKSTGKVSMSMRNGFNNLAKESREKARTRARERTKEKMMLCTADNANRLPNYMDQNMQKEVLGTQYGYSNGVDQGHTMSWNPSGNLQIGGTSHQLPFEDLQFYAKPWETYN